MNNQIRNIHEISGLKNVLVDGFRYRLPAEPDPYQRYFILSHFHSDHYGGLNGSWSHGLIICTSTTANLIISKLKVPHHWIRILDIGNRFIIQPSSDRLISAEIEFLDANHCPGAVIVICYLKDEKQTIHVHCGDMRYHPRMKEYPFFQSKPNISKLYLDTTYAHPKHDFISQVESINTVVNISREFIASCHHDHKKYLIFVSAYTIGKEKLLNALLDEFNHDGDNSMKVYVDEEKMAILRCLVDGDYQHRIMSGQYTTNKHDANIHVCGMNFAGSIWGLFKAKFDNIQQYINDLDCCGENESSSRRVLAFIPTGWADSSAYNKKNPAITQDHMTVRIVPYSEHSQYYELIDFVSFLRPKEIIPTVFKDEENRLFILDLFRNHVDSKQKMREFIDRLPKVAASNEAANNLAITNTSSSSSSSSSSSLFSTFTELQTIIDLTSSNEDRYDDIGSVDDACIGSVDAGWICEQCTYHHITSDEMRFLSCRLCCASRSSFVDSSNPDVDVPIKRKRNDSKSEVEYISPSSSSSPPPPSSSSPRNKKNHSSSPFTSLQSWLFKT